MLEQIFRQVSRTRLYRQNIRLMAGVTLFIWCWMLVYGLLFYKPQYTSDSVVLIKDSAVTASYLEPEQIYSSRTTSSNASNPVLNTMGLLKSQAIANALWEKLEAKHPQIFQKKGIKTREQWLNHFKDGSAYIKAKNKPGTDLITVDFIWDDPVIAKEGAEIVLDAFKAASLELNQMEQRRRSEFLDKQVAEMADKLSEIRSTKSDYKIASLTVDASKEKQELTKFRTDFEARLNRTLAAAEGKKAEVAKYQDTLHMTTDEAMRASAIGMNETVQRLKNELYTLTQTHAFLSTTLTEKNPKVMEVQAKIDQVKENLKAELKQTLGSEFNPDNVEMVTDSARAKVVNQLISANAEMIRLNQEAQGIENRLEVINEKIMAFPTVEEALANIEQEEKTLSDSLDALRKKSLEAKLKEAQTLSNVFVVDPPRKAKNPNFPAPLHLIALSIVGGLVAGVAAVVIRYQFHVDDYLKNGLERFANQVETVANSPVDETALGKSFDEALDDTDDAFDFLTHVRPASKAIVADTPTETSAYVVPASSQKEKHLKALQEEVRLGKQLLASYQQTQAHKLEALRNTLQAKTNEIAPSADSLHFDAFHEDTAELKESQEIHFSFDAVQPQPIDPFTKRVNAPQSPYKLISINPANPALNRPEKPTSLKKNLLKAQLLSKLNQSRGSQSDQPLVSHLTETDPARFLL